MHGLELVFRGKTCGKTLVYIGHFDIQRSYSTWVIFEIIFFKPAKICIKIRVDEIQNKWAKINEFLHVKQILLSFARFSANFLVTQDSGLK